MEGDDNEFRLCPAFALKGMTSSMNGVPASFAHERRVNLGELSLHVTEYGADAEPLFLLHGIGSRMQSWWPVVDDLARHFRLIIPDHRGHGSSEKPSSGYLIPDYARDLNALIAEYGVENPKIVGHSLGGMITFNWAIRHPSQAHRIVIEDSPLRRAADVEGLFNGWIKLASLTVDEAAAHYAEQFPGWSEDEYQRRAVSITSTNLAVFEEMKSQNMKPDTVDRIAALASIESPTLLVYGDTTFGGMVPEEDAEQFAATVPQATLARIPEGTHSLHRDFPEQFLAATLPFLLGS